MLVKLRLSLVVVFSSVLGYAIAANGDINISVLFALALGGTLVTAAANALNQVLEREFDCLMTRTADRPVTAGRMKSSEAVMFAGLACLVGVGLLAYINFLTSFLGMLSMVIYAFVYTPLKRYSTIAVAIGAIPGALPVLIGSAAFSGTFTQFGLALFAVQFLWQFPHFWSIGFHSFEDYKRAGYQLLPVNNGEIARDLGKNALLYAILIIPVLVYLYMFLGMSPSAFVLSLALTLGYMFYCLKFHQQFNKKYALRLMFYSFLYLPLFLIVMLIF